jgi:hypothetical protein
MRMDNWLRCVIIFGGFLLVLVVACTITGWRANRAFREKFPPITEAEFLARCRPGTNPAIALRVRRIIADNLGVEYERTYPSSSFIEDLGAD